MAQWPPSNLQSTTSTAALLCFAHDCCLAVLSCSLITHLTSLLAVCLICWFLTCSSNWRCVTLHGTNGVYVYGNVGFNVVGHCYYLEDGVEERNVLERNLAAYIHSIHMAGTTGGRSVGAVMVMQAAKQWQAIVATSCRCCVAMHITHTDLEEFIHCRRGCCKASQQRSIINQHCMQAYTAEWYDDNLLYILCCHCS